MVASLTPEQAALVLLAYVKECEACEGRGWWQSRERRRYENGYQAPSARVRRKPCRYCGYQARLLEELSSAGSVATVVDEARGLTINARYDGKERPTQHPAPADDQA